ncbi:UPC2-like regulatory protein [Fusarium denticulatum]|uniref:UPC2-like regulatory protein n=1 Tax=Fusarium denticulatum TaxID=48507 RepID=A0A8H5XG72_9HYPO|nr:UPC2-like regulatory protein [Fusarium denticulatum]
MAASPAGNAESSVYTTAARSDTFTTGRVSVTIRNDRNPDPDAPESWPCDQPSIGVECSKTLYIWQEAFPQIGFRYPFVLHALLGLAALHIAYTSPTERTRSWLVGTHHHNEALSGFQRELSTITEENSEALFSWSICNVLYVFATSNPLYQGTDGGPTSLTSAQKEKVLGVEWIPMMRGLQAVLLPTHNYLRFGRMKAIMSTGNWDKLDPEKESQDPEDAHFCRARESWSDSDRSQVYEEALQVLRKCRLYSSQFREMDSETRSNWGYNKEWSAPLMFIHFAPESYFALLRQRQPPALILFSLFGALLHRIRNYWFLEGWGKAIVEVIADILGSYWREWLLWSLEVIQE